MKNAIGVLLSLLLVLNVSRAGEPPDVTAWLFMANENFAQYQLIGTEAQVTVYRYESAKRVYYARTYSPDADGAIRFQVPLNVPFTLVFWGGERKPEMVSLLGGGAPRVDGPPVATNEFHICLLTKKELVGRFGEGVAKRKSKSVTDEILADVGQAREGRQAQDQESKDGLEGLKKGIEAFKKAPWPGD